LVEEGVGPGVTVTIGWIDVDEIGRIATATEEIIPEVAVKGGRLIVDTLENTWRGVIREGSSAVAAISGTAVRGDLAVVAAIGIVGETFVEGGCWAVTEEGRVAEGTIMGNPSAIGAAVAVVAVDVRGFSSVTEVRVGTARSTATGTSEIGRESEIDMLG
jgi:hypothetical protein